MLRLTHKNVYDYAEIFEITEWRDGMVYKTRPKGFMLKEEAKKLLCPDRYIIASMSTTITRPLVMSEKEFIEVEEFTI